MFSQLYCFFPACQDSGLKIHIIRSIIYEKPERREKNIRVLGYIDNFAEYLDAADLMITKPGGGGAVCYPYGLGYRRP